MADEAEVQGVGIDELLDFVREFADGQRSWKNCRVWRDSAGKKKMCQPAITQRLKDTRGVGRDRRSGAVIAKQDWDSRKVEKALKKLATDDYAAMSVAERREKFCNIGPGEDGVPYMTVNSAFSLKMLNGEEDETYTKKMPQHTAWEDHYKKDLMCLRKEEEAVALYLNLLPRADNGVPQILCVDYDDADHSLIPQIWFDQLPWLMTRKGYHFYMNVTDMPAVDLSSQYDKLVFSGELFGGAIANVYETHVGWCEDEDGQRSQTEEEPLRNWDEGNFENGWKFADILQPWVSTAFYTGQHSVVHVAPSRARITEGYRA
eukprot:COSAG04_NODE_3343_length_2910_cov_634.524724_2_plen_318_part_00